MKDNGSIGNPPPPPQPLPGTKTKTPLGKDLKPVAVVTPPLNDTPVTTPVKTSYDKTDKGVAASGPRRIDASEFGKYQQHKHTKIEESSGLVQTVLRSIFSNWGHYDVDPNLIQTMKSFRSAAMASQKFGAGDNFIFVTPSTETITQKDEPKEEAKAPTLAPMTPVKFPPRSITVTADLSQNSAPDAAAKPVLQDKFKKAAALAAKAAITGKLPINVVIKSGGIGAATEIAAYATTGARKAFEKNRFLTASLTLNKSGVSVEIRSGVDPVKSQLDTKNLTLEGRLKVDSLVKHPDGPKKGTFVTGTVEGKSITLSANDILSAARSWQGTKVVLAQFAGVPNFMMPTEVPLGRNDAAGKWHPIMDATGKPMKIKAADMDIIVASQLVTEKATGAPTSTTPDPVVDSGSDDLAKAFEDAPTTMTTTTHDPATGAPVTHAIDLGGAPPAEGSSDPAVTELTGAMAAPGGAETVQQSAKSSNSEMDETLAWFQAEMDSGNADPNIAKAKAALDAYMKAHDMNAARDFVKIVNSMVHLPTVAGNKAAKLMKALVPRVMVNARLNEAVKAGPAQSGPSSLPKIQGTGAPPTVIKADPKTAAGSGTILRVVLDSYFSMRPAGKDKATAGLNANLGSAAAKQALATAATLIGKNLGEGKSIADVEKDLSKAFGRPVTLTLTGTKFAVTIPQGSGEPIDLLSGEIKPDAFDKDGAQKIIKGAFKQFDAAVAANPTAIPTDLKGDASEDDFSAATTVFADKVVDGLKAKKTPAQMSAELSAELGRPVVVKLNGTEVSVSVPLPNNKSKDWFVTDLDKTKPDPADVAAQADPKTPAGATTIFTAAFKKFDAEVAAHPGKIPGNVSGHVPEDVSNKATAVFYGQVVDGLKANKTPAQMSADLTAKLGRPIVVTLKGNDITVDLPIPGGKSATWFHGPLVDPALYKPTTPKP